MNSVTYLNRWMPLPGLYALIIVGALTSCSRSRVIVDTQETHTQAATITPEVVVMPTLSNNPKRIAATNHGFCVVKQSGQLRCRIIAPHDITIRAFPQDDDPVIVDLLNHATSMLDGDARYHEVTSNPSGFCALTRDGALGCWPSLRTSQKLTFEGVFVQVASGTMQTCALREDGALVCARYTDQGYEVKAALIDEGPFERLNAHHGSLCAVGARETVCTHDLQFRRTTRHESPGKPIIVKTHQGDDDASAYQLSRMKGSYLDAMTISGVGACSLQTSGTLTCQLGQGDPRQDELDVISSEPLQGILGYYRSMCGERRTGGWVCTSRVKPTQVPRDARQVVLAPLDEDREYQLALHSIDASGVWRVGTQEIPDVARHDFVQLDAHRDTICGLRADDTVHCYRYFDYDDDFVIGVSSLESSSHGIKTSSGWIGHHATPEEPRTSKHGELDERNAKIKGYVDVQHGNDFGCGLKKNGRVTCWGSILGHALTPPPKDRFSEIALTGHMVCGITLKESKVLCWSYEGGEGSAVDNLLAPHVEIKTSYENTCARQADDTITCWGASFHTPLFEVPFKSKLYDITLAGVCAVEKERGEVSCWGWGYIW